MNGMFTENETHKNRIYENDYIVKSCGLNRGSLPFKYL